MLKCAKGHDPSPPIPPPRNHLCSSCAWAWLSPLCGHHAHHPTHPHSCSRCHPVTATAVLCVHTHAWGAPVGRSVGEFAQRRPAHVQVFVVISARSGSRGWRQRWLSPCPVGGHATAWWAGAQLGGRTVTAMLVLSCSGSRELNSESIEQAVCLFSV